MSCFKAVRAIVFIEKRVPVALLDIAEGEILLGKDGIIFRKVLNDMLCQESKFPRCHLVVRIGPAGGVHECTFLKPEFPRPRGHRLGKALFRSAKPFGHHDTGVIAGLDNNAAQQISDADAGIDFDKHLGAALFPGLLADRQGVFHIERAVLQPLEHHGNGHQLAHGGWRHKLVGILLQQNGTRIHIEDKRFPGRGFNRVRSGSPCDQEQRKEKGGKKSDEGGPEIHGGRAFSHSLFRFLAVNSSHRVVSIINACFWPV